MDINAKPRWIGSWFGVMSYIWLSREHVKLMGPLRVLDTISNVTELSWRLPTVADILGPCQHPDTLICINIRTPLEGCHLGAQLGFNCVLICLKPWGLAIVAKTTWEKRWR